LENKVGQSELSFPGISNVLNYCLITYTQINYRLGMNDNRVQRITCGLKKKQWEKGRNYVRGLTKSTEIKARFPLNFGRHTHDDRMKIRALRNIHPGSCHCKNTLF